jgi:hypothetical protein
MKSSRLSSNHSAPVRPFLILVALCAILTGTESVSAWSVTGFEHPQQEATKEPEIGQTETSQSEATPMSPSAMQAETPFSEATPTTVQHVETVPPVAMQQPIELAAGSSGTVLSLSVSGGSNYNETITISTTVQAITRVNNSNFYFEIRAPDGTVVAMHSFGDVPRLEGGETFSYSWTSNNSSYPLVGDYSVSLCWSPGGSQNCNIASATTTFYSANTLGALLTAALVALVGRWLWRKRKNLFDREAAG